MTNRIAKTPPTRGPWAWREYLPSNVNEWLALRDRAIEARPAGVDVMRFADWALAEMRGEPSPVKASNVLSKYRRTLYELTEETPPPVRARRRRDAGLTDSRTVARMAAGAALGAVVAYTTGNPALALLAPVIPERESYVELGLSTAWDELAPAA